MLGMKHPQNLVGIILSLMVHIKHGYQNRAFCESYKISLRDHIICKYYKRNYSKYTESSLIESDLRITQIHYFE